MLIITVIERKNGDCRTVSAYPYCCYRLLVEIPWNREAWKVDERRRRKRSGGNVKNRNDAIWKVVMKDVYKHPFACNWIWIWIQKLFRWKPEERIITCSLSFHLDLQIHHLLTLVLPLLPLNLHLTIKPPYFIFIFHFLLISISNFSLPNPWCMSLQITLTLLKW